MKGSELGSEEGQTQVIDSVICCENMQTIYMLGTLPHHHLVTCMGAAYAYSLVKGITAHRSPSWPEHITYSQHTYSLLEFCIYSNAMPCICTHSVPHMPLSFLGIQE